MSKGFFFPPDYAQQWDGFNEPGVEHFSGSPFRSLGREGAQNSFDARKNESAARIFIKRIDVPTASIPDLDGLKNTINRCSKESVNEGEKAVQFFENAEALLNKPKISVLQFSDYNTKGMKGPCENGQPFFAFMKATGQSKKDSGTASGSFGIGKFAPYTVSGLRTIFLTTVWQDESGEMHHYVQGKAILMSHREDAQILRGTGFWGIKNNCMPLVGEQETLPEWLKRDVTEPKDTGTTLHILAFTPVKGWQTILAASIAESFFGAIWKGDLEVEIEGGPVLNRDTLSLFFFDNTVPDLIKDQKNEPESFKNSSAFLKVISSTEKIIEDTQNTSGLGHCRVSILVGESLPKKVAILRNGMLITSELTGLKRFGEFKEFAAVVECLSEPGNKLLRDMEPPAHDDFEPARLLDAIKQGRGRRALKELGEWVREMLKRHAQDPAEEVTEINELAEFFGDDQGTGEGHARDGEKNPTGSIKIRARPMPKKKNEATMDDNDASGDSAHGEGGNEENDGTAAVDGGGVGDGAGGASGGSNDSTGGNATSGGGGGGHMSTPSIALKNVRAVVVSPKKRRVSFTPDRTGDFRVELEDSGADTNRFLAVTGSSSGTVADGRIKISCTSGTRVTFEVDLDQPFAGTLRVKANAI